MLLRHAKSDRTPVPGGDHARPLNPRGERNAALVGRYLSDPDRTPDSVITSTAVRARQTLQLAMDAGGWKCPVREAAMIYSGSVTDILDEIKAEDPRRQRLLVVGHQPAWSDLASRLIGGGEIDLPTAALVAIRFEVEDWESIGAGRGSLAWLVTPALLGTAE